MLTGAGGGKSNGVFDLVIKAPSEITSEIQDMHSVIYHAICAEWEAANWRE